jgi:hypothetical protein
MKRDSGQKEQSDSCVEEARAGDRAGHLLNGEWRCARQQPHSIMSVAVIPCFPVVVALFRLVISPLDFDRSAGFMGHSEDPASRPAPFTTIYKWGVPLGCWGAPLR